MFKHQDLRMFDFKLSKYNFFNNCCPFNVVGRGSETQLQMVENLSSPGPVYPICAQRWSKTPFILLHKTFENLNEMT